MLVVLDTAKKHFLLLLLIDLHTNIRVKFIDPIKHVPSPLEKLVNYLSNNSKPTEILQKTINTLKQKFSFLRQAYSNKFLKQLRKGVFPYDYMDKKWKE